MDKVVNTYLYYTIVLAIVFFIFTSPLFFWIINRISVSLWGPTLYSYNNGGVTLSGRVVMALLVFGLIFAAIDQVYSTLNGDEDSNVTV